MPSGARIRASHTKTLRERFLWDIDNVSDTDVTKTSFATSELSNVVAGADGGGRSNRRQLT
jgi:hypothetical protein